MRLHEGNWWVSAFGEWAGYYPYCEGGDARPCDKGTLFSASGIRDEASRLDWYGEVYDSSAPLSTSTDMGSGEFANAGFNRAAYIRNMIEVYDPKYYRWWDTESTWATDPDCYSVDGVWHSIADGWRNWLFVGGPGKEGDACS
ncbi:MAG: neprosin family prolyl endopeptidase [Acidimicrobiia bacterium]|nr:neprosin family prolyl endopeptidase [Acidimicrobiia bacterium]